MPIAKKSETEIRKVSASNQLSSDALETLSVVSRKSETRMESPVGTAPSTTDDGSRKYSDTVIARLTKGKRAEFKSFFARYGITMNSGIEMCIEYVVSQVESGDARISKAGVQNTR